MQVILMKDVKGIGKAGTVAKVSDGYARNLLLPKGMAKEATPGALKELKERAALDEAKRKEELAAAQTLAKKIESITLTINTKSGEGGKLFGSITNQDIANALKEQEKIEIDKRKFILNTPIKHIGEFNVEIKLYTDVSASCKVKVM
ncbi:50S ribosomal protein L9 [Sinanaerobacter sp. ZZT-01]|uniref:50S ribosomal protein L9 n=1 Tax=Sinanaerobacter sp. ZZT-01 TaxID=3111540 RepID=UPI002D7A1536|nr:50S ribosomal protein L9 [Sinanaerobacter sp. ZZT-01]WRR94788.1 50S ribosomal protein L9 [Sinanaerobacter sp. ZZT-01]